MQRFAVIGLGRFGSRLAANLTAAHQEVIAVDKSSRIVEEIRDQVTTAVALDATDEQALRAQGVDQVDIAVVGIGGHFEAAALTTVVLKQIGVKKVISRAVTPTAADILRRIGADDVVNPEDESADRWAVTLANPWFLSRFELDEKHSIVEMPVPPTWAGKTLIELKLRKDWGIHIVAIRSTPEAEGGPKRRQTLHIPMPDRPLEKDAVLMMLGSDENLSKVPRHE